jgi:putative ABC transport system ATP-binding protein
VIVLRNISKTYNKGQANAFKALKGIDLVINEGEMVAIMGASGSGKSTLLNIIGILDTYDDGEYILDGVLMKNLTDHQSANCRSIKLGFVFQSFNLISYKSALENIALPLYYQRLSMKARNRIAEQYLQKVGLIDLKHHKPSELSGGQKQRIAIARALVSQPKIILADEPTGALDSNTSLEIIQLFKEINNEGKTLIIVTHNNDVADQCNRVVKIVDGKVLPV